MCNRARYKKRNKQLSYTVGQKAVWQQLLGQKLDLINFHFKIDIVMSYIF